MHKDLTKEFKSTFLSTEKDITTILYRLFVENPKKNELLRLLIINNKDCLDDMTNEEYNALTSKVSLRTLRDAGYIKLEPKISFGEFPDVKSHIVISFDNFTPNATNPEFRNNTISFDVICHTDYWDIGNCRLRPFKIMGYIDGILDNSKLSGIGTLHFLGAQELILNQELSGYTLTYYAIHDGDDKNPKTPEEMIEDDGQ